MILISSRTSSPLTLNSNNDVTNQINVTSLLNNNDVINNHHMTPEEQIVVNQTKDALSIYQRQENQDEANLSFFPKSFIQAL